MSGSRFALVKNPEDLTDAQRGKLDSLKRKAGSRLFRAWELKEDLRAVFRAGTLVSVGGKQQVPCLFIDGAPLYESGDIVEWLERRFS